MTTTATPRTAEQLAEECRRTLVAGGEPDVRYEALRLLAAGFGFELAHTGEGARRLGQVRTMELLGPLPVGFSFYLSSAEVGRAYGGRYVKNEAGLWDQVAGTCQAPHVVNMEASHLGFAVDHRAIKAALAAVGVAS